MTSVDPRALPAAAASVATGVRAQKPQHLRRNPFGDVLIYLILLASASLVLGPFALSFMTAFKSPQQFASESSLALPNPWTTENFARLFGGDYGFVSPIVVTAQVVAVILVGQLLFSVMAAYAFAKLQFRGRDSLFWVYLATLMVPQVVIVIPLFVMMSQLGLRNTFWSLVLPFMFGSPYAVFLLREHFRSIPDDLIDAARIDGAGDWRILWQIVAPLSRGIISTLAIITVVSHWNNFMWPLIITTGRDWQVITVATANLQSQYNSNWTLVMAATTVAMAPLLVLFAIFQRSIVSSISLTGFK
ncbi:carbohydrate ABC transporter permease [Micropruina glycogenica]|uniref:Carbohydrate ABC transporter membrane protein 2, CUT1 family n=1 Tax=Micropruina glycogenica TaxID=75385 RepID=A0A2N9JDW4_9ACTN|nr:carbohydrate ABC transporter permease [Micropruina glycogenica]SPD85729.1 Carbohydrate ABC transporter membrane protein 2, CUT1 family [Micropruina glycogenica]